MEGIQAIAEKKEVGDWWAEIVEFDRRTSDYKSRRTLLVLLHVCMHLPEEHQ